MRIAPKSLAALMAASGWTGGVNKHGDFGGPLCAESYGDEVQSIVKRLLADSENDKSLAFNNFTDPCPELTKKRLQTLKWFDYADKKKKLPSSPLHWPTGFLLLDT